MILILVVEDEASIQLVLEDALTEGGYAVKLASSAEEALMSQVRRIKDLNQLQNITREVVEAARDRLVIGIA